MTEKSPIIKVTKGLRNEPEVNMNEEAVFKALADETRRSLLDRLFQRDGQTLIELCDGFEMTRHGVMKHLQILEDAELVVAHKVGREKHHYLNPVPIQFAYDRWVSKYAQPFSRGMAGLKHLLEDDTMSQKPAHVYQTFIRTTPERLWRALTDGTFTQQYYMNTRVESSWKVGEPYRYVRADGTLMVEGVILEIDPPHKLVKTFNAMWIPEEDRGGATIVTFVIEQIGATCKLTLTHEDLTPGSALTESVATGWAQVLSGLKTLLETGTPLAFE
ncbi:MAG: SRPBCC domain-containing protein [Anaerolineae bacterium]